MKLKGDITTLRHGRQSIHAINNTAPSDVSGEGESLIFVFPSSEQQSNLSHNVTPVVNAIMQLMR